MKRIILAMTMIMTLMTTSISATPLDKMYPTMIHRYIDDTSDITTIILRNGEVFNAGDSYTDGMGLGSFTAENFIGKVLFVYGEIEDIEDQQMYVLVCNYNADGSVGDIIFSADLYEKDVQLHNDGLIAFNLSNSKYNKLVEACKAGDVLVFYVNDEIYAISSLTGFTKAYKNPVKQ